MLNLDNGRFQLKTTGKDEAPLKNLRDVIRDRRATNHFIPEEISPHLLDSIIDFGLQAPSGYNLQPWRFLVVQEKANKEKLKKAAFNQPKVTEAPAIIIALGMKEEWKKQMHSIFVDGAARGAGKIEDISKAEKAAVDFLSKQNMATWVTRQTMIAVTFMMLAAEAQGLQTAPMEGFDPDKIREAFSLPEEAEVVCLLAIGHALPPKKAHPGRLEKSKMVFFEQYNHPQ